MMKKVIALAMCMMMLFSLAAYAETAEKESMGVLNVHGAFDLKYALPEAIELAVFLSDESCLIAAAGSYDEAKPALLISIAYNDLYSDVERLNDLDADSYVAIMDSFMEEDKVEISVMTTAYGTEVIVVKEADESTDYVVFYTIYKGYEIEMVMTHVMPLEEGEEAPEELIPVTDEEIRMAIQFLSDMDFEPVAAETTAE